MSRIVIAPVSRLFAYAFLVALGIGLSGCSNAKQEAISTALKIYLKKGPPPPSIVDLDLPSGINVYDADGENHHDYMMMLTSTAPAQRRRALDKWVKAGWLSVRSIKIQRVGESGSGYFVPSWSQWRLTLGSDPAYLKKITSAVAALQSRLPGLKVELTGSRYLYFEHGEREKNAVRTANRLPDQFFLALPSGITLLPPMRRALNALVSEGYLVHHSEKDYTIAGYQEIPGFKYGDASILVRTITPRPEQFNPYFQKTEVDIYFTTKKGRKLLVRPPTGTVGRPRYGPPTAILAVAKDGDVQGSSKGTYEVPIKSPLDTGSRKGPKVFFIEQWRPTALARIGELHSLLSNASRRHLTEGMKGTLERSVIFRDSNMKTPAPNGLAYSQFSSTPPQVVRVYSITPKGKSHIVFQPYAKPYVQVGSWSPDGLVKYKMAKRNGHDGNNLMLADFRFQFTPSLSKNESAMLEAFTSDSVPKNGTKRTVQCLLSKQANGWKVAGCGKNASGIFAVFNH